MISAARPAAHSACCSLCTLYAPSFRCHLGIGCKAQTAPEWRHLPSQNDNIVSDILHTTVQSPMQPIQILSIIYTVYIYILYFKDLKEEEENMHPERISFKKMCRKRKIGRVVIFVDITRSEAWRRATADVCNTFPGFESSPEAFCSPNLISIYLFSPLPFSPRVLIFICLYI